MVATTKMIRVFLIILCTVCDSFTLKVAQSRDSSPTFIESLIINAITSKSSNYEVSDDEILDFTGIAEINGFNCEEHTVVTEDGYILKLFRIPGNPERPLLLTHGSLSDSNFWIIRGSSSPALELSKAGYDVWAINLRGTRYSRSHQTFDPDLQPNEFFNFTLFEQGLYDMPATIDYILNETGQNNLTSISHSQGTSSMFVMGAEKPEYNDKITISIALAPIASVQNVRGLIGLIFASKTLSLLDTSACKEYFGYEQYRVSIKYTCFGSKLNVANCYNLLLAAFGDDREGFEIEFAPTFFTIIPGGTSSKNAEYTYQLSLGNGFRKYDYGTKTNLRVYGSKDAPLINLDNVTMKTALLVGKNDYLSTVKDVKYLREKLPNIVQYLEMPNEKFNHLDFGIAQHINTSFYPYLFDILSEYS